MRNVRSSRKLSRLHLFLPPTGSADETGTVGTPVPISNARSPHVMPIQLDPSQMFPKIISHVGIHDVIRLGTCGHKSDSFSCQNAYFKCVAVPIISDPMQDCLLNQPLKFGLMM